MPENNNNDISLLAAKLGALHDDVSEMKAALRDLAGAITKLALVEERQLQTSSALERAFVAIEKMEARLGVIERAAVGSRRTAHWLDRALWAAAAAVAIFVGRKVGMIP